MTADDLRDAIDVLRQHWLTTELDTGELVDLWVHAAEAADELAELARLIGDDAGGRLTDREDPLAAYVTPRGDVVWMTEPAPAERWKGRALARALAQPVRTLDGEVVDAIPLELLLDVLPGVADDQATSSRWRTTGLRRWFPDWPQFRTLDAKPPRISRRPGR